MTASRGTKPATGRAEFHAGFKCFSRGLRATGRDDKSRTVAKPPGIYRGRPNLKSPPISNEIMFKHSATYLPNNLNTVAENKCYKSF